MNKGPNDVMLDLETMGVRPYSAVVSIGACYFDPFSDFIGEKFYAVISLESALSSGLTVDAGTIQWWLRQSDAARKALTDAPAFHHLSEALQGFTAFVNGARPKLWGNGSNFDNVLLRCAYERCGLEAPWSPFDDRCYRTVVNMVPKSKRPPRVNAGTAHHALDDAIAQAKHLQKIYKILGVKNGD